MYNERMVGPLRVTFTDDEGKVHVGSREFIHMNEAAHYAKGVAQSRNPRILLDVTDLVLEIDHDPSSKGRNYLPINVEFTTKLAD